MAVKQGETAATAYTVIDDWKFDLGDSTITYQIADTSIATVDADGNVTGAAAGETVMIVKAGKLEKRVNISVYTEDGLVEPTDGMIITSDVKFKPGTYILPNSITIAAGDITVDGNGAVIMSSENPVLDNGANSEGYATAVGVTSTVTTTSPSRTSAQSITTSAPLCAHAKNLVISNNDFPTTSPIPTTAGATATATAASCCRTCRTA